ncbi:MAG: xanthine dehydrogenase accessory protein XdhC [Pseudomonadota bacterium]
MSEWITIHVAHTRGSVPRETGTSMRVSQHETQGTIGGGTLEWEAMQLARQMLDEGRNSLTKVMPLGPDLGQCCGGVVTLEFSQTKAATPHDRPPLFIWGAGHVGRAIAGVIAPLQDREVTLIDDAPGRLPDPMPAPASPLIAVDMPRAAALLQAQADHLVVTYSHRIDLALCDVLLRHSRGHIGLIGSATKWARFRKRLAAMGHSETEISRIDCPIGDPALGKHPQAIAIGVAQRMIVIETQDKRQGRRA